MLAHRFLVTATALFHPNSIPLQANHRICRQLTASAALPEHIQEMVEDVERGDAQLFDVREPQEAAGGMLALAKLVPLSDLQNGIKPIHDPTLTTYLHCAAGVRVHYAAPILQELGFKSVIPLSEGFGSLAQMGLDVQ